ncbi:MAG: ribokinase [Fretibacterium sp.]|nr:ribokinase [Fretibacterium sp.]
MKVLCFGSLNIDYVYDVPHFVRGGETLASRSLHAYTGGKGLNQSVALARAGMKVYHAGAIGEDGTFLLELLREAGVNTEHVEQLKDVRTGHAIIQKDESGNNCILLYGGANQSITRQQIDRTLAAFSAGDALVLQNEISELGYLVERAEAAGMTIVLNPSPMDDSLPPLLGSVDYLLLNEIEAAQLLHIPEASAPEEMAKRLQAQFPGSTILLTVGAQGSLYAGEETILRQSAVPVQVMDTTAAGDTYTGFFLSGVLGGHGPAWAMKYASVAAAIAVTRPGAAPSIPDREEVLSRMKEI